MCSAFVHSSDLIVECMNPPSSPWGWKLAFELAVRVEVSFRAWESGQFCIMLSKKDLQVYVYIISLLISVASDFSWAENDYQNVLHTQNNHVLVKYRHSCLF